MLAQQQLTAWQHLDNIIFNVWQQIGTVWSQLGISLPIVAYVVVVSVVTFAKKNSTLGYALPLTISNWNEQSSSENKNPEEIFL